MTHLNEKSTATDIETYMNKVRTSNAVFLEQSAASFEAFDEAQDALDKMRQSRDHLWFVCICLTAAIVLIVAGLGIAVFT